MYAEVRQTHRLSLNRQEMERELAEEMAAHSEMMPEDRQRNFGSWLRLREEVRDVWAWVWLDQLWQDFSYGARMLWRSKGFTAGAIAVLALGVGVNLAEYQIFDAAGPHRLSMRDADSIVEFFRVGKSGRTSGFPLAAVEFYRANSNCFAWIVSEDTSGAGLKVENDTDVRANFVSGNYFQTLRILPAWGRLLTERDARVGAPPRNLPAIVAREKINALSASFAVLPGVDGVTVASVVPLFGLNVQNRRGLPPIYFNSVAPSYFDVMHLPVLRGRVFRPGEQVRQLLVSPARVASGQTAICSARNWCWKTAPTSWLAWCGIAA